MTGTTRAMAILGVGALLLGSGCASGGSTHYTRPEADLGAIRTVAVLPFSSLTGDVTHADKVERVFQVELLALGVVDVVESGTVAQLFAREQIASVDTLTPGDLQRIGAELGADGLFLGTVVDFTEVRAGSTPAPEVTLQLRLVESASGLTAWESSQGRRGPNVRSRLFGFGGDSLTEVARKLIREQLGTLIE